VSNSIRKRKPEKGASSKPSKPYPDFPLQSSTNGYWQKRINGKLCYFGRWGHVVSGVMECHSNDGWKEALAKFNAEKDALYAGRVYRPQSDDDLTLKYLCNHFLTFKKEKFEEAEIVERTLQSYYDICEFLLSEFGRDRLVDDITKDDFKSLRSVMAKRWSPTALANMICRVKTVFKHAYDEELIERPMGYGNKLNPPPKRVKDKYKIAKRRKTGKKLLSAAQIRALIDAADLQLRCWILLGINAGLGPSDLTRLPITAIDFDKSWLDFPRVKNGNEREASLWPETTACLQQVLEERPKPKTPTDLVFLRKSGLSWEGRTVTSSVTILTSELMKRVGCYRKGISHYVLRHTFATVAGGVKDQVALNYCMGHSDGHISAVYREEIDPARIEAVANFVRAWLFDSPDGSSRAGDQSVSQSETGESENHESHDQHVLKLFAG
jgi:integrase